MSLHIVRNALYVDVAERVRDLIFSRALPADGAKIDEVELCKVLNISRTPLREALKVLAREGLVRLIPRHGCFVRELSEQDLDEIFPVMALLEGRCAYEAALKAMAQDFDKLDALHAELERCASNGMPDEYYEVNYRIHELIQNLAGNQWLSGPANDLRKVLRLYRQRSVSVPDRMAQSYAEHCSILAVLKLRDAEGANALMQSHLLRQREALRQLASNATSQKRDTAVAHSAT
jgi:DNA-binding GntR family transcriptional regulator